ncbi:Flp family type IVb pilin [Rhizorhapis suberifaciens]|uniref:Flp pilus assembly pilin Flp n=1 Tax=Rhizorhapis suberifaciens TaxID=13656 RepID=A0A840HUZ5_9SPHN|nr:hypothetical protein [Rhizorhapis suberifaciens]MBB4641284.1 Flp pilus assembly pilin Flp [Rhizorhapis suberifaciens]
MILAWLRSFARDRSGASAAEYALLLGVIGTGLVLASFNLGQAIASSLERSASLFASIEPSEGQPAFAAAAPTAPEADAGESSQPSNSVPGKAAAAAAKSNPHNDSGSDNGNSKSANNNGKGSGK